jgi:hypothetical protein
MGKRAVVSALRAAQVAQKFQQELFQPIRTGFHLSGVDVSEAYMRTLGKATIT